MIFNNLPFKAMEKSVDALWLQQQVISQNISNYDTPGYKARSVRFDDVLQGVEQGRNAENGQGFRTVVEQDQTATVRLDGNSVDMDAESLKLYKTYVQSSYLYQRITGQFTSMSYVLNNAPK